MTGVAMAVNAADVVELTGGLECYICRAVLLHGDGAGAIARVIACLSHL